MRPFASLSFALFVFVAGCGCPNANRDMPGAAPMAPAAPGDAPAASAPSVPAQKPAPIHPAPFTAEQIRDATKPGRSYVFRMEMKDKPVVLRKIHFLKVDKDGAEVESVSTDEKGAVLEQKPPKRVPWTELRSHGEWPNDRVTTSDEEISVPAGKFRCTLFTVREDDGSIGRYWFAKDMPGAPVRFTNEKGGVVVLSSALVEHKNGS